MDGLTKLQLLENLHLMPNQSPGPSHLPSHVEEAMEAMAAMHAAHHSEATVVERWIDRVITVISGPLFPIYASILLVAWVGAGLLPAKYSILAIDPPPYPVLALILSCAAFFIAVLILASQSRADRLANLREQLTLETVLLTTQKVSKLIDLIEELRRDIPNVRNRVDLEAIEMAGMPDHNQVIAAIQEINETAPEAPKE